jgi:hypothetical protein
MVIKKYVGDRLRLLQCAHLSVSSPATGVRHCAFPKAECSSDSVYWFFTVHLFDSYRPSLLLLVIALSLKNLVTRGAFKEVC